MPRAVNVSYSNTTVRKGDLQRPNLEQALRDALSHRKRGQTISQHAEFRRFDGAPDYGTLVMNHVSVMRSGIFLELMRYAPGSRIPLIATGGGGSEFALQNADTPRGTDLVRGFLYALVLGNHFLYVNREVAVVRCEQFMEWMLGTNVHIATPDLSLSFAPIVGIEELPSVGRVVVRPREPAESTATTAVHAPQASASGGPTRTRADSERLAGSDVGQILRAAHFTDARIAALEAKGIDIEVKLEVYFKQDGSKYEVSRADITDLLSDAPDKEVTLYSKAGRERQGQIKRITYLGSVETVGEFFDRGEISGALWEAYRYFNQEGYI